MRYEFRFKKEQINNYKDLDIYQLAQSLAYEVHQINLPLPEYKPFNQENQIKRSSKSINDNIREGFGRRRYKDEYIRFLVFAHSLCNEVISQLEMINDIYFKEKPLTSLIENYIKLGGKISKQIQYVEKNLEHELTTHIA